MAQRKFIITGYLEYTPEEYTNEDAVDIMLQEAADVFHDQVMPPGQVGYGLTNIKVDYERTPQ